MPIEFDIDARLAGFAAADAQGGDTVGVVYRELVGPADGDHLLDRLERTHASIFSRIPGLPRPSEIHHILVLIRSELSALAYVNELQITASVTPKRDIRAGEPLFASDMDDVSAIDLGVEIPDDVAVVFVRSHGWRRSLFFDFGPLLDDPVPRDYRIEKALAEQLLLLWGIADPDSGRDEYRAQERVSQMRSGILQLEQLLEQRCEDESEYQELLEEHPWMFAGMYDRITRHRNLDDSRIPDFTGRRAYDLCLDVIEIKQPFLRLFRQDGGFGAPFNDAWNQGEGYLTFCQRQRAYLRDEKDLLFENPRCLVLLGVELTDRERRWIREKESLAPLITVWTYDELLRRARHMVGLLETAEEGIGSRTL